MVLASEAMSENLERNEGLKILARIIAKAYLADSKCDVEITKTQGRIKRDGRISQTNRSRSDGNRSK